jgi:hypothetical protein
MVFASHTVNEEAAMIIVIFFAAAALWSFAEMKMCGGAKNRY